MSNEPCQDARRAKLPMVGPYILGKTLGVGSTGKVKMAVHQDSGQAVAIKIIKKDIVHSRPGLAVKVQREIGVMKHIRHKHVVELYNVYETPNHLYIVMELVRGGELFNRLVKKKHIEEEEGMRIFVQIISGLDHCHRHSVCHRDLKPENLLLDQDDNIKIADFGMASFMRDDELLGTSCGSPHYAAPEVIAGTKYDGKAADVWSAGVILFVLLSGRLPFDDDNIPRLLAKVRQGQYHMSSRISERGRQILQRMLVVDPTQRITLAELRKVWLGQLWPDDERTLAQESRQEEVVPQPRSRILPVLKAQSFKEERPERVSAVERHTRRASAELLPELPSLSRGSSPSPASRSSGLDRDRSPQMISGRLLVPASLTVPLARSPNVYTSSGTTSSGSRSPITQSPLPTPPTSPLLQPRSGRASPVPLTMPSAYSGRLLDTLGTLSALSVSPGSGSTVSSSSPKRSWFEEGASVPPRSPGHVRRGSTPQPYD